MQAQNIIKIDSLQNQTIEIVGNTALYLKCQDNIIASVDLIIEGKAYTLQSEIVSLKNIKYLHYLVSNNLLQDKALPNKFSFAVKIKDKQLALIHVNYKPIPKSAPQTPSVIEYVDTSTQIATPNNTVKYKSYSFPLGDNIFSDAKFLVRDLANTKDDPNLQMYKQEVLKKYNVSYDSLHLYPLLKFYKTYLGGALHADKEQHFADIAKMDVTNFATGMARFLAERAKQELNESFFVQMHKQLNAIPELKMYFPESHLFLGKVNASSMHINLEQLKTVFERDVQKLPRNIYKSTQNVELYNNERLQYLVKINDFFANNTKGQWIDYALGSVFVNNGQLNPKALLYNFVHSKSRQDLETKLLNAVDRGAELNLLNTIKLVELISSSLLSPDPNSYWVNKEEFNALLTDSLLLQTFIGLLIQKADFNIYDIKFNATSFKSLIETSFVDIYSVQSLASFRTLISSMYSAYNEVDQVVKSLANTTNGNAIDQVYKVFNVMKDNVGLLTDFLGYNNFISTDVSVNTNVLYSYVYPAIDIAYNLHVKKYSLAINEFVSLIGTADTSGKQNDFNKFIHKFSKYGMLIGNVAAAESSDQVKAAIEATVLPVGSSRIKRYANHSISINAYAGGFYGTAFYKEQNVRNTITTFGVTAPIGISYNLGLKPIFNTKNALSITAQVIDLGSLVNFYYQKGDGAQLPAGTKIQLGDILAPGALLSFSLFNTPLTIMGGVQYVPGLSRMPSISTNTDFRPITWRYQVGLVIDMPLFNLKVW